MGGDGTLNAAANWLIRHDIQAPLAILPAGTGNNLARGLDLPLNLEESFHMGLTGMKFLSIDAMDVSCRRSASKTGGSGNDLERCILVQSGALGFPAEIAAHYQNLRQLQLAILSRA